MIVFTGHVWHNYLDKKSKSDVTSEIKSSLVMFNVAWELSQSMGKTKFPATLNHRPNLSHR